MATMKPTTYSVAYTKLGRAYKKADSEGMKKHRFH